MNNKWEEGNKGDNPSTRFEAWGVYVPVCLCLPWARVGAVQQWAATNTFTQSGDKIQSVSSDKVKNGWEWMGQGTRRGSNLGTVFGEPEHSQ